MWENKENKFSNTDFSLLGSDRLIQLVAFVEGIPSTFGERKKKEKAKHSKLKLLFFIAVFTATKRRIRV